MTVAPPAKKANHVKVQPPSKGLVGQPLLPPVQISGPEGCAPTSTIGYAYAIWHPVESVERGSATVTDGVATFERLAVNAPGRVRLTFTTCGPGH